MGKDKFQPVISNIPKLLFDELKKFFHMNSSLTRANFYKASIKAKELGLSLPYLRLEKRKNEWFMSIVCF